LEGKERRQFPRRLCAITAQLTAEGYSVGIPVKIVDISLGGCYIEMFSPLPKNIVVELSLKLGEDTLQASGIVRSSQTGFGMGVAFTSMSSQDLERLKKFAPSSANVPILAQPLFSTSKQQPGSSTALPEFHLDDPLMAPEAIEAIVRVLCKRGLLTTAEVLEEIEKLKVSKV
jgi:PilZ domain